MASAVTLKCDSQDRADTLIQDLLRSLLACVDETAGVTIDRHESRSEEVLLDVDVDDARYLVVRMPKRAPQRALLSPREREIVRMVAQGHPNKIIADCLGISSYTVSTYLRRIFAKTGVGSRAAMVAKVIDSKHELDSCQEDLRWSRQPAANGANFSRQSYATARER